MHLFHVLYQSMTVLRLSSHCNTVKAYLLQFYQRITEYPKLEELTRIMKSNSWLQLGQTNKQTNKIKCVLYISDWLYFKGGSMLEPRTPERFTLCSSQRAQLVDTALLSFKLCLRCSHARSWTFLCEFVISTRNKVVGWAEQANNLVFHVASTRQWAMKISNVKVSLKQIKKFI